MWKRHPYPLIAWDIDWPWLKVLAAIPWNGLIAGALTVGLILLAFWVAS